MVVDGISQREDNSARRVWNVSAFGLNKIIIKNGDVECGFTAQDGWRLSVAQSASMKSCYSTVNIATVNVVIIWPIAIAYSMGQIIKFFCVCPSVRVCVCVCVSVCGHSPGRISSLIFTKLDTYV